MQSTFRKLLVWQKAMDLAIEVYELMKLLPRTEQYGLVSQIQRCAVSIVSNIAEGSQRRSALDFAHFLDMALGSSAELETQLLLAARIYPKEIGVKVASCLDHLEEVRKMTVSLRTSILKKVE